METEKDVICKMIKKTSIEYFSLIRWKKMRSEIYKNIAALQPGKPADGMINFIAYNIGKDKPRMKTKTGKFLGKKLKLNTNYYTPAMLESIASMINLKLFGTSETNLLYGSDITDAYRHSIGSGSCMCGVSASYTKLYENNPSRFAMLTMFAGNAQARAIVHTLDDGSRLLDRIYTNNRAMIDEMMKYARKEGWFYRDCGLIKFDNKEVEDKQFLKVSDLDWCDGEVPYMDTLDGGTIENGKLTIAYYGGELCLDSTEGCLEGGYSCEDCGETMSEDDTYNVGDYLVCNYCYNENYFVCDDCEETYNNDDSNHISDIDRYVCDDCRDAYGYCDDCGNYVEETTEIVDKNIYVCDKNCLPCYTECDDCGDYNENISYLEGVDVDVCNKCIDDYSPCEECSDWSNFDDVDVLDGLCLDCHKAKEEKEEEDEETEELNEDMFVLNSTGKRIKNEKG